MEHFSHYWHFVRGIYRYPHHGPVVWNVFAFFVCKHLFEIIHGRRPAPIRSRVIDDNSNNNDNNNDELNTNNSNTNYNCNYDNDI